MNFLVRHNLLITNYHGIKSIYDAKYSDVKIKVNCDIIDHEKQIVFKDHEKQIVFKDPYLNKDPTIKIMGFVSKDFFAPKTEAHTFFITDLYLWFIYFIFSQMPPLRVLSIFLSLLLSY